MAVANSQMCQEVGIDVKGKGSITAKLQTTHVPMSGLMEICN